MANAEKIVTGLIAVVLIIAVSSLFYVSKSVFFPDEEKNGQTNHQPKMSRMSFTPFDIGLAKELMDKDNDGKCDSCGMDVDFCIQTGQLECNMDSKSTIGVLQSQHIHADWKIYINGETLSFEGKDHMERMRSNQPVSSFIHVDSGAPPPEKTGDIIHMHATGVPLWIFFNSIGMDFNKDCITMENKEKFCNAGNKKLKFFVNGKENNEFENYVFNDLDKILISYDSENEEEILKQLNSMTDFAKIH